jgi:hypothetical protein
MLKDYLTEKDIEELKNRKYQSGGYSWLDNQLNPFWNTCADILPYV